MQKILPPTKSIDNKKACLYIERTEGQRAATTARCLVHQPTQRREKLAIWANRKDAYVIKHMNTTRRTLALLISIRNEQGRLSYKYTIRKNGL